MKAERPGTHDDALAVSADHHQVPRRVALTATKHDSPNISAYDNPNTLPTTRPNTRPNTSIGAAFRVVVVGIAGMMAKHAVAELSTVISEDLKLSGHITTP